MAQVVYDLNNSAISLLRLFGAPFNIRQVLDLQLAFEALDGDFGADAVTIFGQRSSHGDAACRCLLLSTTNTILSC